MLGSEAVIGNEDRGLGRCRERAGMGLVDPTFTASYPMPRNVAGAPPATVVCAAGLDGGRRYAARLRAAGVEVHEVRDVD